MRVLHLVQRGCLLLVDMRVQQQRYRLGVSTIVDLLTSQEALNQAEVDVVNARFDYLRAKAQSKR